ncbi:MAG: hypothetical protein PHZ04_03910 [Patescibacteria group bacterium]|nr:hypothetical protein [Patescibacteria group bacterium]MDD5294896.1 hypothetical protein [Patescibacteria group bacterium]MDD5554056.1 hypothetical protein [Patescibacteria group bacterium]
MQKITKEFRIKPSSITEDSLKELGKVLEKQIKERRDVEEKGGERRSNCGVLYTIRSEDESIEYVSMDDLLNSSSKPNKIKSISFRVNHYDDDYVDIYFRIGKYSAGEKVEISSKNEGEMLATEKSLKIIFEKYSLSYGWFLNKCYEIKVNVLAVLVSLLAVFLIVKTLTIFYPQIQYSNTINFALYYFIFFALYIVNLVILKLYFPFYMIDLSGNSSRKIFLKFFSFIFTIIIIPSIPYGYNLLKEEQIIKEFSDGTAINVIEHLDSGKNIWDVSGNVFGYISPYSVNYAFLNPYKNISVKDKKEDGYFEVQKIKDELFLIGSINDEDYNKAIEKDEIKIVLHSNLTDYFKHEIALKITESNFLNIREIEINDKKIYVLDMKSHGFVIKNIKTH